MKLTRLMRPVAVLALMVVIAMAAPGTARAQPGATDSEDGRWMPWLGCWELTNDRVGDREERIDARQQVCLTRDDAGPGVLAATFEEDREILSERLVADGSRQPIDRSGCQGWKEARFSDDGDRLFTHSSLVCEGDHRREVTGISLIDPSGKWLDIEVVATGDRRELMVRRYRFAGGAAGDRDLTLAAATARVGAGETLDARDVVEALEHVDPAAVEAALLETDAAFEMNAELLLYLDDAGVPGQIVDLMVALSYPDYFVVDGGGEDRHGPATVGGGWYLPAYSYGYWSPFFAPLGYGRYPVRPVIVVSGGGSGGKVIQGRGYTRVRTRPGASTGGLGRLLRGGSSVGRAGGRDSGPSGGGTVTPGGHRQGGDSGRKAKPRGGDDGDEGR